jgi:hypothetical protein
MRKFEEIYVAIWCIVMPVTGTVLLPSVQGTIPAYMLALGSGLLIFLKIRSGEISPAIIEYGKAFLYVFLLWLLLLAGSQLGLLVSDRHDFRGASMIDPNDNTIILRATLFTQSLYLLACVMIALYFRYFFQASWMRYVYWGGFLLAGYGIYEWTFFLVFHQTGDFLVNRTFGDHPASWSQPISFGGIQLLRIKSTLGEPTFFAAVVIPYFYLAMDGGEILLSSLLLFAALFSTSTACYIALGASLFIKSFWSGRVQWKFLGLLGVVALFLGALALLFPDTFQSMFLDKFNGDNNSGAMRIDSTASKNDLYRSFTIPNWIFGVGFGYSYMSIYDALLVNTGVIGLGVFLWMFIRPLIFLPARPGYEGHKAGLLGILIMCGLSLSELFLPTTWMFLGLAYYKLAQYRREQREFDFRPPRHAVEIDSSSEPPIPSAQV